MKSAIRALFSVGIALVLATASALADIEGWSKEEDAFAFWATSTEHEGLRVELFTHGGIPRLEAFEPVPERPGIWRLRYYAGTAGTSFMVSFRRAAVIDLEAGRVLGDGMISLEPQDGSDWEQPRWEWADRFVVVHEPDFGETFIQTKGPWFADFGVERQHLSASTPVKLSGEEVPRIRDALTAAANRSVNFAGHYRLVTWGCGSGCVAGAILDKKTGAVTELPFAAHRAFGTTYAPLQFRADSRLLIVAGNLNEERDGTFYFLWDGKTLQELP